MQTSKLMTISQAEEYLGFPKKYLANNWRKFQARKFFSVIKLNPDVRQSRIMVEAKELDRLIEKLKKESR